MPSGSTPPVWVLLCWSIVSTAVGQHHKHSLSCLPTVVPPSFCSTNLLRRLSWFLSQPLLLYLKSYILTCFDYCDVVWSGCTKDEALCLETLLNFACRTDLCRHRDYSASAVCSEFGLSTLSTRRKLHLAQTMFKCLSSQPPAYLSQLFCSPTSHYNTHSSSTCHLICLLQELASGKRLSILQVLPCSGLFQRTLELVKT